MKFVHKGIGRPKFVCKVYGEKLIIQKSIINKLIKISLWICSRTILGWIFNYLSSLKSIRCSKLPKCMGRRKFLKKEKKKLKVFVDKHSCFGNCVCRQLKNIYIIYSQSNLYKCYKGHVMFQDKRPSLPLTFVKRMRLLALICFKLEGTSGLTGNRGHRGHTVFHEERPS